MRAATGHTECSRRTVVSARFFFLVCVVFLVTFRCLCIIPLASHSSIFTVVSPVRLRLPVGGKSETEKERSGSRQPNPPEVFYSGVLKARGRLVNPPIPSVPLTARCPLASAFSPLLVFIPPPPHPHPHTAARSPSLPPAAHPIRSTPIHPWHGKRSSFVHGSSSYMLLAQQRPGPTRVVLLRARREAGHPYRPRWQHPVSAAVAAHGPYGARAERILRRRRRPGPISTRRQ